MFTGTKSCLTTSTDMLSANPRLHLHRSTAIRRVILRASDEDAQRISTENIYNHVCLNRDLAISSSMQAPACPADSPCQTDVSLVLYLLGISAAASLTSLRPQFLSPADAKIAQFLCSVSPFRMNTCKSVSKQRTLTAFRMNTCEKTRGRGYPGPGSRFAALAGTHKLMLDADARETCHPEGIR
jgi:hypothetical protein